MDIDIYLRDDELKLYRYIIVNSIKDRFEKVNVSRGIVALSGGVDSSLVAALSKAALGDRLLCLIMPEEGVSPEEDTNHALEVVRKFNINYRIIPINGVIDWFTKLHGEIKASAKNEKFAIANVKPRIRMIINYLYANTLNGFVIGTSNKTELLLGYGTKYGDIAVDFYPIGDLYKTQVWQLSDYVGIPTEIIRKKPSAGLWAGQTDEEELGHTYYEIDRILYCLVELELSVRETCKVLALPREAVSDIYKRVINSEHKRKIPTITRLSHMCLDKDWRYPADRH
ncbi:MAG TPA: NAD+ synthase [Candidatus Hydrothermia bacterium]|nr:NAD+ synthase [Candidatus Hydrothermae bacterium]MDD3649138.1 NAD+ synthase [Candidatus Hydrothermia bacterium]MDD5572193.1 NAD+ synthase [Candidatus Hydrothermia bacterium]HOK23078.1 NAD+ synthase [Candidatus Hydrothermia bacterium]HOL23662.1 NAD+ synthase [Candidatus Hydrothermia bacterium]